MKMTDKLSSCKANDVLVIIISGKRPGDFHQRPTEILDFSPYKTLIISNDSDGYKTDIPIIDVPSDYREDYVSRMKLSNAYYAPMNRSYAMEYARRRGFRYVVQVDDNIDFLQFKAEKKDGCIARRVESFTSRQGFPEMAADYVNALVTALECTNCGWAGVSMAAQPPREALCKERFSYSFFALDLERCKFDFHGDTEDDIEYHLRLAQQDIPFLMLEPLNIGKVDDNNGKDLSGCRGEYAAQGLSRGARMRVLYGDSYSCGMGMRKCCTPVKLSKANERTPVFRHRLKIDNKPMVTMTNPEALIDAIVAIGVKYGKPCDANEACLKIYSN